MTKAREECVGALTKSGRGRTVNGVVRLWPGQRHEESSVGKEACHGVRARLKPRVGGMRDAGDDYDVGDSGRHHPRCRDDARPIVTGIRDEHHHRIRARGPWTVEVRR